MTDEFDEARRKWLGQVIGESEVIPEVTLRVGGKEFLLKNASSKCEVGRVESSPDVITVEFECETDPFTRFRFEVLDSEDLG